MRPAAVIAIVALAAALIIGAVALAGTRSGPTPAGPSPDTARQTVPAPIDDLQVLIRESNPPQATLKVKAGLPSGCARYDSHSMVRSSDTFTVTVLNSMPLGDPICTMIYGTYELTIDLGKDLVPGTTYTVRVNDRTTTFKT
jgi:hypothetical protein